MLPSDKGSTTAWRAPAENETLRIGALDGQLASSMLVGDEAFSSRSSPMPEHVNIQHEKRQPRFFRKPRRRLVACLRTVRRLHGKRGPAPKSQSRRGQSRKRERGSYREPCGGGGLPCQAHRPRSFAETHGKAFLAVYLAAMAGHDACLRILIKAGADVRDQDDEGDSCALWAAKHGLSDVLKMLAKAGAPMDVSNQSENCPPNKPEPFPDPCGSGGLGQSSFGLV